MIVFGGSGEVSKVAIRFPLIKEKKSWFPRGIWRQSPGIFYGLGAVELNISLTVPNWSQVRLPGVRHGCIENWKVSRKLFGSIV